MPDASFPNPSACPLLLFLEPCRRPLKRLPPGEAWLHGPKLDGWRVQAVNSDVTLSSRNGRDLKGRFGHDREIDVEPGQQIGSNSERSTPRRVGALTQKSPSLWRGALLPVTYTRP